MPEPGERDIATAAFVVLCADDAAREKLAYWLNAAGAHVAVAQTGHDARRSLAQFSSVLLITDRLLPPWPGLDTIVNLKVDFAGAKVAYIDDGVPDNRRFAVSAGADIVLPHPLRRSHVLQACFPGASSKWRLACAQ